MLSDLSHLSHKTVDYMMRMGCFLKIFPYVWDPIKYELKPLKGWKLYIYRFHTMVGLWTCFFVSFRFFQTVKIEPFPSRVRVMNVIWFVAYFLLWGCNHQFDKRRDAIMNFTNALFRDRDRVRRVILARMTEKERAEHIDWRSIHLLIGFYLLMINPPAHATLLIGMPCAPFYISSLILPCEAPLHLPITMWERMPFVIVENFVITEMMFVLAFNWTLIFEGMNWISERAKDCTGDPNSTTVSSKLPDYQIQPMEYRQAQILTLYINDAFKWYLQLFPIVNFTTAGLLLFGAIRYTHLNFNLYVAFPFCGFRCLFEAITALTAASNTEEESTFLLERCLADIYGVKEKFKQKYLTRFYKSCKNLKGSAGSLYAFDHTIVIVSLNHCLQLTFNMLITYQ